MRLFLKLGCGAAALLLVLGVLGAGTLPLLLDFLDKLNLEERSESHALTPNNPSQRRLPRSNGSFESADSNPQMWTRNLSISPI